MKTKARYVWSNLAIHPGESLAEEIEFRGISVEELACLTNQTPRLICAIIRGEKPISPKLATALDSSLEIPAQFWLNLQSKYDLTLAHNELVAREGPDHACDLGDDCPARKTYDVDEEDEESEISAGMLMDEGEEFEA